MELTHIPQQEALRYLGYRRPDDVPDDVRAQVEHCIGLLMPVCHPRFVWRMCRLTEKGSAVLANSGLTFSGEDLPALLRDCDRCVLFALTLGDAPEALIRKAAPVSKTQALLLDACASAACEQACDQLQALLETRLCTDGIYATDRFSPGYGDLPLSLQPSILSLLDAQRQIGLTLTDTCIMLPRKSVTAVFGLADKPQGKRARGCAHCSLNGNCSYRKAGITCA